LGVDRGEEEIALPATVRKVFVTTMSYDAIGRLATMTYPYPST